ncbi:MAG: TPM domain-containing protein [Bacteroidia bacterium]|nr:TPM domain-containing protein [Bacteroidia bacterium]
MNASSFFSKEQQSHLLAAVKEAEKSTSGEIRVHIETNCSEDVLDRAAWIFNKLKMHNTADRNGVLFYLAVTDRKFAVIGDGGINAVVPEGRKTTFTGSCIVFIYAASCFYPGYSGQACSSATC